MTVDATGCLGRCGAGPNVALWPRSPGAADPLLVSYMACSSQLAHLFELQVKGGGGTKAMYHALEARAREARSRVPRAAC